MNKQDRRVAKTGRRIDKEAAQIVPGNFGPCERWNDDRKAFEPATDPRPFRIKGAGVDGMAFFSCRDVEHEATVGIEPLFIVCEYRSGAKLPTFVWVQDRERAEQDAVSLILSTDDVRAMTQGFAMLGNQRNQTRL